MRAMLSFKTVMTFTQLTHSHLEAEKSLTDVRRPYLFGFQALTNY